MFVICRETCILKSLYKSWQSAHFISSGTSFRFCYWHEHRFAFLCDQLGWLFGTHVQFTYGWCFQVICRYSTSASLSPSDTLIHEFYGREVANPVLLTVDTAFAEEKANIKVFVSTLLTLGDRQLAAQFHEVQLDLRLIEAERIGCKCFLVEFDYIADLICICWWTPTSSLEISLC